MADLTIKLFQVTFSADYSNFKSEAALVKAGSPYVKYGMKLAKWNGDEEGHQSCCEYEGREAIISGAQLLEALAEGLNVTVNRTQEVVVGASEIFALLGEKPTLNVMQEAPRESGYNERCEVHMPGQALSMYNDTMLMEDACTDALQENLNRGWRIIAACPQPDQRRPDYVLGRWCPEEMDGGARRG